MPIKRFKEKLQNLENLEEEEYEEFIYLPPIPRLRYDRHSQFNRLYKSSYYITREKWHRSYNKQLRTLYRNFELIVNRYYPENKTQWINNDLFNRFSLLLYDNSSKYISPYIT